MDRAFDHAAYGQRIVVAIRLHVSEYVLVRHESADRNAQHDFKLRAALRGGRGDGIDVARPEEILPWFDDFVIGRLRVGQGETVGPRNTEGFRRSSQ